MSSFEFATDADVLVLYPSLADAPPVGLLPATRDIIRECAECEFNPAVWGCYLKLGHIHYTAFLSQCAIDAAKLGQNPNAPELVGALASVTEGPQSVSFQSTAVMPNPADQVLMTKKSGQLFVMLRDGLGPVPVAMDNIGCGSDF